MSQNKRKINHICMSRKRSIDRIPYFLLTIRVILKNKMSRFHKVNSSKIKRDSHTHFFKVNLKLHISGTLNNKLTLTRTIEFMNIPVYSLPARFLGVTNLKKAVLFSNK